MTDSFDLSEHERLFGEHGHTYVYYPKDVIQNTFRLSLIKAVEDAVKDGKSTQTVINLLFRGYD